MTQTTDSAALRFLVEEFADPSEAVPPASASRARQREAARILLPAKLDRQRRALEALSPDAFHKLRRNVRRRLEFVARGYSPLAKAGIGLRLAVKLTLVLTPGSRPGAAPIVDGTPRDVLWFYVVHLLHKGGASRLALCEAPRSQREDGPRLCGQLYVRRGEAKQFCSPRCRARVATQRMRRKASRRHR